MTKDEIAPGDMAPPGTPGTGAPANPVTSTAGAIGTALSTSALWFMPACAALVVNNHLHIAIGHQLGDTEFDLAPRQ